MFRRRKVTRRAFDGWYDPFAAESGSCARAAWLAFVRGACVAWPEATERCATLRWAVVVREAACRAKASAVETKRTLLALRAGVAERALPSPHIPTPAGAHWTVKERAYSRPAPCAYSHFSVR